MAIAPMNPADDVYVWSDRLFGLLSPNSGWDFASDVDKGGWKWSEVEVGKSVQYRYCALRIREQNP